MSISYKTIMTVIYTVVLTSVFWVMLAFLNCYNCPKCGEYVVDGNYYCSHCGQQLRIYKVNEAR